MDATLLVFVRRIGAGRVVVYLDGGNTIQMKDLDVLRWAHQKFRANYKVVWF